MKKRLLSMFFVAMLMPFVMQAQTNAVQIIQTDTAACNSFTWGVNDSTYTMSGAYTHVSNDTVYILDLRLGFDETSTVADTVSAGCYYAWGDTIIRDGGTYTKAFTSAEGCDSIVTMTFNILDTATNTIYDTVCASKEFYGVTYTTDTVVVGITTIDSCPTIETLYLSIIKLDTNDKHDTVVACDKYSFTFRPGFPEYTTTVSMDTNTDKLSRSNAAMRNIYHPRTRERCFDSTYYLHITINNSSYAEFSVTACDVAEFPVTYTTTNGTRDSIFKYIYSITDTIMYVAKNELPKCDSHIVVNVTVHRSPIITINGNTLVAIGDSTTLTASSNQSDMRWVWDNGSTEESIVVTIDETGNKDVSLTGTNTVTNCTAVTGVTILTNVGIDEAEAQQVVIYPNPASTVVNIESAHDISSISIYNTVGQLIYAADAQGNKTAMDVSNYASGTYMMRMVLANGTEVVRTMIVRK